MPNPRLAPGIALAPLLCACLSGGPTPSPDASPPAGDAPAEARELRVTAVVVEDLAGRVWSTERAPQRPRLVLELSGPLAEPFEDQPEPVMLLEGPPSDDRADDLEDEPLRRATEEQLVPALVTREGERVTVEPPSRLEAGAVYTLAVAAWARSEEGSRPTTPFVAAIRIAPGAEGGTRVLGSWPADGAAGVPRRLPLLAVRLDGPAEGLDAVRLLGPTGAPVAVRREGMACTAVGWPDGHCVALRSDVTLAPAVEYRLEVGSEVVDPTGAPVGPWSARFRTGSGDSDPPPRFTEHPCAIDEDRTAAGCVLRDDGSITLRARVDRPARLWLSTTGASTSDVAARGDATLRLDGLEPDTPYGLTVRAIDLAGAEATVRVDTATHSALARVAITEVRADPRGPEPAQEYVEVASLGDVPIDLGGFALADRADREGDLLPEGSRLAAGGRALVVADGFDPSDPDDPPVPPGVPLIRVGSSLGSGGLTNGGEPLFLRDREGRRVSAAPSLAAPDPGACIVRVTSDPRRGDEAAFAPDALGGCTPGRPDRLP